MPRLLEALPIVLRVKRDEFTHPTGDDSRDALTVGVERRNLSRQLGAGTVSFHTSTVSRAPSAAASRGVPRSQTPTRPARRTWSAASSPPRARTSCGCAISRGMRCWDGVLYLAFVIDVYSRRVVGWQLATHMRDTLVIDALRMALCQRPRPGADVSSSWSTATAGAVNTRPTTTSRSSTTTTCCSRSGPSVTHWTTPWPNRSWTRSRPS